MTAAVQLADFNSFCRTCGFFSESRKPLLATPSFRSFEKLHSTEPGFPCRNSAPARRHSYKETCVAFSRDIFRLEMCMCWPAQACMTGRLRVSISQSTLQGHNLKFLSLSLSLSRLRNSLNSYQRWSGFQSTHVYHPSLVLLSQAWRSWMAAGWSRSHRIWQAHRPSFRKIAPLACLPHYQPRRASLERCYLTLTVLCELLRLPMLMPPN